MLNVSNNLSSCCPKPQIALANNNNSKPISKSIAFQAAAPAATGSKILTKVADFFKTYGERAINKIKDVAIKIWNFCVDKIKSFCETIKNMFKTKKGGATPAGTP